MAMTIEKITLQNRRAAALGLAWNVFLRHVAPDYTEEGVETFKKFIDDVSKTDTCAMYGAYDGDVLAGMIAAENSANHIVLFFVEEQYRGAGVGRALFSEVLKYAAGPHVSVNSSPFALGVYQRLGFTPDGPARTERGIAYIPMTYIK